jgi:hypothetical protein
MHDLSSPCDRDATGYGGQQKALNLIIKTHSPQNHKILQQ